MTKQTSKVIALAALAGLVLAGSGCKTVCHSNQKAGYATIVCQPEDVTIEDAKSPVKFKVVATGCGLTYRWYRFGQPIDESELKDHVCGIYSEEIELHGDWKTNCAVYSCVIGSENSCGQNVQTSTRYVFLNYNPTLQAMSSTPTQTPPKILPQKGPPQMEGTFQFCYQLPFGNVKPPPTNPPPHNCVVTLMMIDPPTGSVGVPVPSANYYLKVVNGSTQAVPVDQNDQNPINTTKNIPLPSPLSPPYKLVAYCNCAFFPTDFPKLYFKLEWQN